MNLIERPYLKMKKLKKACIYFYDLLYLYSITPKFFPFYHLNFLSLFYKVKLYYCNQCKFGFLSKKLNSKKLNTFYKKSYWRWMTSGLKVNSTHNDRSLRHAKILKNLVATNVIDIGGGDDSFLNLFPNSTKILIEPSAIKPLNKKIILFRDISEISSPISLGLFRLSHVLEHVIDIDDFLSKVCFLMGSNSFLLIEVPDIKDNYQFMHQEHGPHTFMFSQKSLEHILKNYNFVTLKYWRENGALVYLLSR